MIVVLAGIWISVISFVFVTKVGNMMNNFLIGIMSFIQRKQVVR